MSFVRKTGTREVVSVPVDSAAVIAVGDAVQTDEAAGDLIAAATTVAVFGVALEASASGNTDPIDVDKVHTDDIWEVEVSTSDMSAANAFNKGNLASANTVAVAGAGVDFRFENGFDGVNAGLGRGKFILVEGVSTA